MSIPKIIHYCWFGNKPLPKSCSKLIASWKKQLPDYTIMLWNEKSFDVTQSAYVENAYRAGKYAFVSDYARLFALKTYGGIYFDTDVELLKRPDELLKYEAFYGFENDRFIATGLGFGAERNHPSILAMKAQYLDLAPNAEGTYPMVVCPALNTAALLPFGLKLDGTRQNVAGAEILPVEYLNPYDDPTGRLEKTHNTISVHWYSKSWMSKGTILRSKLTKPLHRIFGVDAFKRFRK